MDPDLAFDAFCRESGFEVAHGMSAEASGLRKPSREDRLKPRDGKDIFATPTTPFVPTGESVLSRIEPGAIGSVTVLALLISAIGYGAWTVLQEVQKVQVAPVEQAPVVAADIDPLANVQAAIDPVSPEISASANMEVSRSASLDRLYRPQALDVPVLVARDAPIATLNPQETGAFAAVGSNARRGPGAAAQPGGAYDLNSAVTAALGEALQSPEAGTPNGQRMPQVVEDLGPSIRMVATEESWVRVRSAEGNTLFETVMKPGQTYDIPVMEGPPTLRTGNAGAIYFAMGTDCYGPVGGRGEVTSNVALERVALLDRYQSVNPADADSALNRMFATLEPTQLPKLPCHGN
ncbi:DUF4115 domain-containing protein [Aliishimia ponticola]